MKIKGQPGEFGFKALIKGGLNSNGWYSTNDFYFSEEEVRLSWGDAIYKWPVEFWEDGSAYVPTKEELTEEL